MRKFLFSLCAVSLLSVAVHSQQLDYEATGAPLKPEPADAKISAAMRQVSAENIQRTIERLVAFKNRNTLSSMETDLPEGTGITAAAEWIKSQFEAYSAGCGGCLEVKEDVFIEPAGKPGLNNSAPRIDRPTKLTTVYAILKGIDPAQSKRRYLITGHYDTRISDVMDDHDFSPGANDDSSGTAVSLECARVLSKQRFPATLVFVTVPGEEQGLNGSKHLAELAKSEGWDLEGVLNNDIVGGNTTPGETHQSKSLIRVFSENVPASASVQEMRRLLSLGVESDSPSRELAREVSAVARAYFPAASPSADMKPVLILRLDRYLRGGDHRSFNEAGFPAVRFTEWREDFNHQHQKVRTEAGIVFGDLIQFDDFAYIAKAARLNAAVLSTMASAPGMPLEVRMLTRNLDNNSVIQFEAPAGAPGGTWFEVVWRETNASDWQYGAKAALYQEVVSGQEHTITVPISKDNVIFGVRSCDVVGHCSAAVTPLP